MSANLCFIMFLLLSCLLVMSSECNSLKNVQQSKNDIRSENIGRGLISGGVEAERTETPWKIVIFQKQGNISDFICGGSLLNSDLIVTAAHCLHQKGHEFSTDPTSLEIILGAHRAIDFLKVGRKTAYVKEIIIHDGWNPTSESFNDDIALLRLNESVEFDEYIQPIRRMNTTELKEFGKVVGWGSIDNKGVIADIAKIDELKTMEIAECLYKYRNLTLIFWPESFCAVKSVSAGDSGSSFYFEIDGKNYLKGLVSSRIFNAYSENAVALFTDITKYHDFIQEYFNYVKNVLKFECKFSRNFYECRAEKDEFNFDLRVTEIQLSYYPGSITSTKIEKIVFYMKMIKKFPKFQKQLLQKSIPNSNLIEMHLNNDKELAKQLPSFLKRVDWIRKFWFVNLLIDEDSLNIFDEADQMEELVLWNCKFPNDHLPARLFSKLISLTFLQVESRCKESKIKTLDENVLLLLRNLIKLDLSGNKIKTLPENLFQSLTKLETLYLDWNEIEVLPQNLFKNNQNLQGFSLSKNKLKEIRFDFRILPKISRLRLLRNDCIDERFKETSEIHEKAEYIMNKCKTRLSNLM